MLIGGRDPFAHDGGSESYMRAHAHTARLAGYDPHLFALGRWRETLPTEFATLHRLRTPLRPVRSITSVLQRPFIVPAIVRHLRDQPGPHVLHAFGAWADTAVVASRMLARSGVEAIPIATAYVAIEHEATAKLGSSMVRDSIPLWLAHRLELAWVRAVTVPVERRSYQACRTVLVNYETVRTMLKEAYGPGMDIRRLTYASADGVRAGCQRLRSPAARSARSAWRPRGAADRGGQPP